jgi:hypothetical protein
MTSHNLPRNSGIPTRISSPHREGKPSGSNIDLIARRYLRELVTGGVVPREALSQRVEQSNLSRDLGESYITATAESAAEFLQEVIRKLRLPEPRPEQERIEIAEEEQVILVALPRGVRSFVGFKNQQVLWSWDFRFAAVLGEEDADKVQRVLSALGHECVQRPVLPRAEEAF